MIPTDVKALLKESINNACENLESLKLNSVLHDEFEKMIDLLVASYKKGGALYVAGNGGSAADAQHLVAELVVKLDKNRDPIKAYALTVDSSILTATGNDFSYDDIFSRQVEALMTDKDVFLGITTSGNSQNIIKAFQICKNIGAATILLTGKEGGRAFKEKYADVNLIAPGLSTARIQESHELLYHTLCFALEKRLVEEGLIRYR